MLNVNLYNYIRELDKLCVYTITKDKGVMKYKNINDLASITAYSTGDDELGPIMLINGEFRGDSVYLVVIGGTEFKTKQNNGINTDIMSALELNNGYLLSVKDVIKSNIPVNNKIIIIGSSLGGMIAQQVVCDNYIKDNYDVISVITFGSPIISPSKRCCRVKRMCDKSDIITKLSLCSFIGNNEVYDELEKCVEDGGYKSFIEAHKYSYIYNEVWSDYDVMGVKYGSDFIILDMDSINYYDAFN